MLITLRQLQYVIAVADTGSFSKAADICHAEQSTVSQQVKSMEEKIGVIIFDRNTLPVKVTPEGLNIISQAKHIIEKVEELLAPFKTKPGNFS
ncbi:MAG: LysR family transcriptional regulator [Bacteroidia bacterium]|nr:LysR family transcriptional regulator [Bacteroidia bacterium]